ncbi:glucose-6-phosphate isomerase [Dactylosporangium sp. NPDC049525]|uniref:glucose-6-phosphate isomerase n=1 Tax=Dactylosporangium sp. NPDC049525 TaxID=3154730 RepID=UPI00341BD825
MSDLLDDVTAAAGLTVFGAAAVAGGIGTRALPGLPDWSPDYDVMPRVTALRAELRALGLDRVVLADGDAAAPTARAAEAITRTLGVPLTVLSGTDPHGVATAVADRLQRTVVVLTSTSPTSTSLATDSHRRAYLQAFEDHGIQDVDRRFVFVAVPGSPLATIALEMGAQLFLAQPGALSAHSLVPAGLAGADIGDLVEQAFALAEPPRRRSAPAGFALPATGFTPALPAPTGTGFAPALSTPTGFIPAPSAPIGEALPAEQFERPAAALGAALAAAVAAGRDKLALAPDGSGIVGLGEWIADLLTTAGSRAVPVVLETPSSWGHEGPDVLSVTVGGALVSGVMPGGGIAPDLAVNGPLGAQLLAWEQALTVAGLIDPAAPTGTGGSSSPEGVLRVLDTGLPPQAPAFVDGAVEVHGAVTATTLIGALDEFARAVPPGATLAVHAHLDRTADAAALAVRTGLAGRVNRAVTFAWGGAPVQPATGVGGAGGTPAATTIQITGAVPEDLRVPGRPYTFGDLQAAEAADDRQALLDRGVPLLRLHLTDRNSGIDQLLAALGG